MLIYTAALLALANPGYQAANLSHSFEKGTKVEYAMAVDGEDEGMGIRARIFYHFVVGDTVEGGGAKITLSDMVMDISAGGTDLPPFGPTSTTLTLDKAGTPANWDIEFTEENIPIVLAVVFNRLPAKEVEKGAKFKIEWKPSTLSLTGEGAYMGVEEKDGKKMHVIKTQATLTPVGASPGEMNFTSRFNAETMILESVEGTIAIDNGSFNLMLKRQPA